MSNSELNSERYKFLRAVIQDDKLSHFVDNIEAPEQPLFSGEVEVITDEMFDTALDYTIKAAINAGLYSIEVPKNRSAVERDENGNPVSIRFIPLDE